MQSYQVTQPKSLTDLQAFLQVNQLPFADVQLANSFYLLYEQDGELIGSVGFEWYDEHALLRSVAIAEKWRGKGQGKKIGGKRFKERKKKKKEGGVLLTERGAPFFLLLWFN